MKTTYQFCQMLIAFIVLPFQYLHGQDIDVLKAELKIVEDDELKVKALNELAWFYQSSHPDTALLYAREAVFLAKANGLWSELGTSYNRIGNSFYGQGFYDSACYYHAKSLELRRQYASQEYQANSALNLGMCFIILESYDQAIAVLNSALSDFNSLKDQGEAIYVKLQLAAVYLEKYDLIQARMIVEDVDSAVLSFEVKDRSILAKNAEVKARLFKMQISYSEALQWSEKSLSLYRVVGDRISVLRALMLNGSIHSVMGSFDSCRAYYAEAMLLACGQPNTSFRFKLHANLMQLWLIENNQDSAEFHLLRADSLADLQTDSSQKALLNKLKGDYYLAIGKPGEAVFFFEKSLKLWEGTSAIKRLEAYFNLYGVYAVLGKHDRSKDALWRYEQLSDSLESVAEQARAYENQVKEKNHENELLLKENERSAAHEKLKDAQLIYTLIVTGILIVALLVVIAYQRERNRRRLAIKDRELAENNKRLLEEKIEGLLKKQELKSIVNVLEIQETERRRIAQDLHDRLGGMLATVKLLFQSIEVGIGSLQTQNRDAYNRALTILDGAGDEVRKVAHNLVSGALKNFGLEIALKELGDAIQTSESITFESSFHGLAARLSLKLETHVYRIVKELVSNTLKHAKAKKITLQLLRDGEKLNIVYEDDGIGFDSTIETDGIGMKNIASRVQDLEGEYHIDSGKGAGTTVIINVPIKTMEDEQSYHSG